MITQRPAQERGMTRYPWLESYHTFSFADYYDPDHMGFRSLRVINDDKIAPAQGFGLHPHRDMEIITLVFSGALAHKDSMGNGSIIKPGEAQRMSAGTGVQHSEWNASETEVLHLLQIWILPNQINLPPSYDQRQFAPESLQNKWCLIASADARENSLLIHQEADLYMTQLTPKHSLKYSLKNDRGVWLQVVTGEVTLNNQHHLHTGDGVAIEAEKEFSITAATDAQLLLFDLL